MVVPTGQTIDALESAEPKNTVQSISQDLQGSSAVTSLQDDILETTSYDLDANKPKKVSREVTDWLSRLKSVLNHVPDNTPDLQVFSRLANLKLPTEEPDLVHANWPLLLKRLEEKSPDLLTSTKRINRPGLLEKENQPIDNFFALTDDFNANLRWLTQISKVELNQSGDMISAGKPMSSGKLLPAAFGRGRKFYRHGDSKHFDVSLPDTLLSHIKANVRSTVTETLTLNQKNFIHLAESISYLREVASTANIMLQIVKNDESAQSLSPTAKAAIASVQRSVTDMSMGHSTLQANLTLLKRDQVISNIHGDILKMDLDLSGLMRSDPLEGPIIATKRIERLDELRKKIREKDVSFSLSSLADKRPKIQYNRGKARVFKGYKAFSNSSNFKVHNPSPATSSANSEPLGKPQPFRPSFEESVVRRHHKRGRGRGRGAHRGSSRGRF